MNINQSNYFALSVIPWEVGYKRTHYCGGEIVRPL